MQSRLEEPAPRWLSLPTSSAYVVAVMAVLAALALRWAADPLMHGGRPYLTLFGAVALAVWVGGAGPGVFAIVLGFFGGNLLFGSVRGVIGPLDTSFAVGAVGYALSCAVIVVFGHALRRAQVQLQRQIAVRRQAELDAIGISQRLRTTLLSIGDGVMVVDRNGNVTTMNPVAETLTGWPIAEALGAPLSRVFNIINQQTREPVDNPALRALHDGTIFGLANHTVLIARDGRERPIDDSAAPVMDALGERIGAVLVFRDVTERYTNDQALRQTSRLLQTMVAATPVAIAVTDLKGVVQSWNPAAETLFGWPAAEVIGHPLPIDPEELAFEVQALHAELRAGEAVAERLTYRHRRDGLRVDVRLSAAPLLDEQRHVTGMLLVLADATEARRAQAADARLAAMFRCSGEAVVLASPDGLVEEWNAAAESLLGYTRSEALGMPISRLAPPDKLDEQAMLLAQMQRSGTARVETARVARDGTRIDVVLSAAPVLDAAGAVVGFSAFYQDMRARAEAERALRFSEATLRTLYENSPLAMGMVELAGDDDLLHIYDNPVSCRLFGLPPGGTANRLSSDLGAPAATRTLWRTHYLRSAEDGAPVAFEFSMQRSTGLQWLAATVSPIEPVAGGAQRFIYITQDVTERRGSELRLRQSEKNARLALDVARLGTWSWNPADGAIEADPRCRDIVGLKRQLPAQLDDLGRHVHAEDWPRVEAALREAMRAGGDGAYSEELRFVDADGGIRWAVARGQVLYDRTGAERKPLLLLGTLLDVTPTKQAERDLAAADARKDQFMAVLAHELRNPLAPIRTGLHILQRTVGDPAGAETAARTLDVMNRQLGHMVRLIDDLMDLSRISRDQLELRRERLDLALVLDTAVEASKPWIDARRHRLVIDRSAEPLRVDGDLTRLSQVLTNLLNNAAKYTPAGGRITLGLRRDGDEAVITVADNGIGIARDMLHGVFEIFAQVDRGGEFARSGLGIGLAISKRLAELHGGSVEADSAGEGEGSIFTVRLPLLDAVPDPTTLAGDLDGGLSRAPRRVLIVDDNREAADTLAELLQLIGHTTLVAHSGAQALATGEAFAPQIALLDIGMPEMDGVELARRLRLLPWGAGLRIVAVTGWGEQSQQGRLADVGFDHHLVKPVSLDEIERVLEPPLDVPLDLPQHPTP